MSVRSTFFELEFATSYLIFRDGDRLALSFFLPELVTLRQTGTCIPVREG